MSEVEEENPGEYDFGKVTTTVTLAPFGSVRASLASNLYSAFVFTFRRDAETPVTCRDPGGGLTR